MDLSFFTLSKIAWVFISPDSLLLLSIVISCVLLLLHCNKAAKWLLGFATLYALVIGLVPVGNYLLYPLEKRFETNPTLPEELDGIIVLSGSERIGHSIAWNQVELNASGERNLAFLELARKHPEAELIFTGGREGLKQGKYRGADIAKMLFERQGLDVSRVIFERESRNTFENATFSKALASPKPNEKWVLITTAWHMPRSVGIFCKAEWPVIPYPVDHATFPKNPFSIHFNFADNLKDLTIGVKEWVGLLAYYVTGKTTALFPKECP